MKAPTGMERPRLGGQLGQLRTCFGKGANGLGPWGLLAEPQKKKVGICAEFSSLSECLPEAFSLLLSVEDEDVNCKCRHDDNASVMSSALHKPYV